jgi:hypothetical protein
MAPVGAGLGQVFFIIRSVLPYNKPTEKMKPSRSGQQCQPHVPALPRLAEPRRRSATVLPRSSVKEPGYLVEAPAGRHGQGRSPS